MRKMRMRKQRDFDKRATAWKRLRPQKRTDLLKRLGVKQDKITKSVNLSGVARTSNFWRLPTVIRTLLDPAFDGGRFSSVQHKRHRSAMETLGRTIKTADYQYENSP